MKTLLILIATIACFSDVHAQQVVQENDKLVYKDVEIRVGEMLQLGYGSRQDKGFAFVYGNGYNKPTGNVGSIHGGYKCKVLSWRIYKGKYFVKAKPVGRRLKIYIDVAGAVDNKELIPQ